jgi:hypothetical protein
MDLPLSALVTTIGLVKADRDPLSTWRRALTKLFATFPDWRILALPGKFPELPLALDS